MNVAKAAIIKFGQYLIPSIKFEVCKLLWAALLDYYQFFLRIIWIVDASTLFGSRLGILIDLFVFLYAINLAWIDAKLLGLYLWGRNITIYAHLKLVHIWIRL